MIFQSYDHNVLPPFWWFTFTVTQHRIESTIQNVRQFLKEKHTTTTTRILYSVFGIGWSVTCVVSFCHVSSQHWYCATWHVDRTWKLDCCNTVSSLVNMDHINAIRLLFSRRTYHQFSVTTCLVVLFFYFLMACWTAGSAIASGFVIPMV